MYTCNTVLFNRGALLILNPKNLYSKKRTRKFHHTVNEHNWHKIWISSQELYLRDTKRTKPPSIISMKYDSCEDGYVTSSTHMRVVRTQFWQGSKYWMRSPEARLWLLLGSWHHCLRHYWQVRWQCQLNLDLHSQIVSDLIITG